MLIVLAAPAAEPRSTPYGFHTPPVVRKQAVIWLVPSAQNSLEGGWPQVSQRLQKASSKVEVLEKRCPLIGVRFGARKRLSWTIHGCQQAHERSPRPPDPRRTSRSDGGCAFTFSAQISLLRGQFPDESRLDKTRAQVSNASSHARSIVYVFWFWRWT